MDALHVRPRFRLAPVFEWVVAALFLIATFAVGSMILRELSPIAARPGAVPAAGPPVVASIPAAVPAAPSRCPCCRFSTGKKSGLGKRCRPSPRGSGRAAESGRQEIDRGSLGERLTRFYEYGGSRFILVFEPFERNGEARVAAIYLP